MLQSLLDNQVGLKNMAGPVPPVNPPAITKEKALTVIKDSFISAAERDTSTGDGIVINIITKSGIEVEHFPLRKD
jgi:20S proteasome subunit beta 6